MIGVDYCLSEIPDVWIDIFEAVRNVAPKAVMAGGCLRDLYNKRVVNDIDIFIPKENFFEAEVAIKKTHEVCTKTIHEAYLTHDADVSSIWYYETLLGNMPPVNLILVSEERCTLDAQLARFDFGICQIGYDGTRLRYTDAFVKDVALKTFTLKSGQSDLQLEHSLARWDRLSKKYPEFSLVRPVKQPLADELFS